VFKSGNVTWHYVIPVDPFPQQYGNFSDKDALLSAILAL
jgi:hypothetical protein